MRVSDLLENVADNAQLVPTEVEEVPVVVGRIYVFDPINIKDVDEELHSILTVYSQNEDEIKPYSINVMDPIIFKVIRLDTPVEDTKIVRVQILSDVDLQITKYDIKKNRIVRDLRGNPYTLKLKQLPDFVNLDLISDETFESTYGRRRKPYEHGLVGYLYLDHTPIPIEEYDEEGELESEFVTGYDVKRHLSTTGSAVKHRSLGKPKGRGDLLHHNAAIKRYNQMTDSEHHETSKMQQAIALYKSNLALPRVAVIKLMMSRLNMTRAGASSYYTKAMHAVEDEKDE